MPGCVGADNRLGVGVFAEEPSRVFVFVVQTQPLHAELVTALAVNGVFEPGQAARWRTLERDREGESQQQQEHQYHSEHK